MAYTGNEAKSLVEQLQRDFSQLYDDCRFRWDILQRRHGKAIENELQELGYPRVRPIVSPETEYAARKVAATLGSPQYEVHIEPHKDGDKNRADKLEIVDANLLLSLDYGGMLSQSIHRHQAVSPYAPLWVEQNPYNLPKREEDEDYSDYNERADTWRRSYVPMRVTVGDPTDTAFLEDGNLNITLAAREVEIPIEDFVQDYGEYDKEEMAGSKPDERNKLMLQIWQDQFPEIRAGYGFAEDRVAFGGREKVKICVIDNGTRIQHYVVFPSGGLREYQSIGEMSDDGGWDNPFGMPTLVVIPGIFDQTAARPEDRYQPILATQMQSRWNLDFTWSQWASKAAERPKYAAPLPPELQTQLMGKSQEERDEYLDSLSELQENRITPTFGDITKVDAEANAYEEKLYGQIRDEHNLYLPQAAFSGTEGTQSLLKNTPTSSLLRLDELESQDYEPAFEYKFNGFLKLLQMHDNFWIGRESEQNDEDKTFYVVSTGMERRQGKTTERGIKAEFKSSDFDFPFDRSLHRVDNRVSTQIAQLGAIKERMTMPNGDIWITDEEIAIALGKEDTQEYLKKVRIETRYKRIQEANDSLTLAAALRRNALTLGVSVQELLLNMSGGAGPGGGGMGGPGPGLAPRPTSSNSGGVGQIQMNPPSSDPNQVGSTLGPGG